MTEREDAKRSFLKKAGWGDAAVSVLAGDASSRAYDRVVGAQGKAVLMDAPRDAEAPACPADATVEERHRLGYNALACLAGPDSGPFVAIAQWLSGHGLSAPKILAQDLDQGFLLLEDLGDDLFADVMNSHPDRETELYQAALDVLVRLHTIDTPAALPVAAEGSYTMKPYDAAALSIEVDLLLDWYLPLATGNDVSDDLRASYGAAWQSVLPHMAAEQSVLVLRDYHAQNLLWLPDRDGVARVGLLDFQDGVLGAPAYDVVSLLEDARRDVESHIAHTMVDYYCAQMAAQSTAFDDATFRASYAMLGAQRNAKIVGIFARLYKRDGKPAYLPLLPRVWRYLERDLSHPALAPVRAWMDEHIPLHIRQSVPQAEELTG